ncbi:MAG: hypothetical protein NVS3B18_15910 [Candidatus Dormibacteria bacterium]
MLLVALPQVSADLRVGPAQASWLVTAYLVAMAATLAIGGHLGDRYGRRRVIITGLLAFGLASTVAALAPNLLVATVARILQAASSSIVFPSGSALLRDLVADERRGRAFGRVGATLSVAAATGPLAGSALVALAGWRLIFLVNLPIVVVALFLTTRAVPADEPGERGRERSRLDVVGVGLLGITLSGVAVLLSVGARLGYQAFALAGLVAGGAVALLRHEARRAEPALRLDLFASRPFATACAGVVTSRPIEVSGTPIQVGYQSVRP